MLPASCKYILCISWNCQRKIQSHANIFPSFSLEAVVYSGMTLAEEIASTTKKKCSKFLKLERRWAEDCWSLGGVPPTSLTCQILQSCRPPLPPHYILIHMNTQIYMVWWLLNWNLVPCTFVMKDIFYLNSEVANIYIRYLKLSNLFLQIISLTPGWID